MAETFHADHETEWSSIDRPYVGEPGEIEVTPEMLRAGRAAFSAFSISDLSDGWISDAEVVSEVYRAMELARRLK